MKFTKITAAVTLCAGLAAPLSAQEATLSAVYSLPATNDLMKSYFAFVEDVNANGEGILQIELRGGTEAVPRNEQMNAVSRGIVDLYFGPAGYYQRQIPELTPIDAASVPADVLREAGLHDAIDAAARERAGVTLLGLMGTGYAFQFYTIDEPPMTDGMIDMSGLKIRGGASYAPMYDALDIARVDVPAGDIYTALERGVVEGIGFTTIGISSAGWQDFLKYRIFPTWRQGNTIIAGNAEAIDALTDEQSAYLMEMIEKHEMLAYEAAQALEQVDTEALAAAGVTDVVLEGEAAAMITAAFQDTFWEGVAGTLGDEEAAKYRAIVDAANANGM
jgi:TRAP-type C4-dicarboxylate transport system substrate-binding protein